MRVDINEDKHFTWVPESGIVEFVVKQRTLLNSLNRFLVRSPVNCMNRCGAFYLYITAFPKHLIFHLSPERRIGIKTEGWGGVGWGGVFAYLSPRTEVRSPVLSATTGYSVTMEPVASSPLTYQWRTAAGTELCEEQFAAIVSPVWGAANNITELWLKLPGCVPAVWPAMRLSITL